jgi:hypothetical protein
MMGAVLVTKVAKGGKYSNKGVKRWKKINQR